MVANTRTAARAGGIRPLDEPLPVQVKVDVNDRPIAIGVLKGKRAGRNNAGERAFICRWRQVSEVADSWRIDDEWWRKTAISRIYYRAIMEDGRSITIFQDLAIGAWYRQGS